MPAARAGIVRWDRIRLVSQHNRCPQTADNPLAHRLHRGCCTPQLFADRALHFLADRAQQQLDTADRQPADMRFPAHIQERLAARYKAADGARWLLPRARLR